MENMNTSENQPTPAETKTPEVHVKFKKTSLLVISLGVAGALILVALFFAKGLFVAATVNGSPISRLSIIRELEKQGGKQTLEAIIDQKLIDAELSKQNITATQEEIDEEMKKIEEQVAVQGITLKQALEAQGMTEEKLREQISVQKKLEKLLADKMVVTEAEIDAYIKDNGATIPKDIKMEELRVQVKEQLKQQKFQQEAQKWVSDLTANASIKYYVNYE